MDYTILQASDTQHNKCACTSKYTKAKILQNRTMKHFEQIIENKTKKIMF